MHDVDMEMVVSRLVMHVELQLVFLQPVALSCGGEEVVPHVSKPGDVFLAQVADGPEVAALDEAEQVQAADRFTVPIEVREQQEAFFVLAIVGFRFVSDDDVFLLGLAVEDVEDPVQAALLPFRLNVGPHVLCVDLRCFRDDAESLRRVFLDVLLRARVDEVKLQVGCRVNVLGIVFVVDTPRGLALAGQVPVVYVVGTEVPDMLEFGMETG